MLNTMTDAELTMHLRAAMGRGDTRTAARIGAELDARKARRSAPQWARIGEGR